MESAELRQSFLDYFAGKGHTVVRGASLLPTSPNLLFTNAGMNPFVPIFLGEQPPSYARTLGVLQSGLETRAADTQKCIRAGGKHNDLEDVGFDTYHHTCFEMLGNWSFGDYFKAEAIAWAWELLTTVWKLPKERLYATVYQPAEGDPAAFDQEAYDHWKAIFTREGLDPAVHIRTGGKKDNFWMMGETGPCGPCSEVHIDLTPGGDSRGCLVNNDSPWCIEIWNLVFIQFAADGEGNFAPLKAQHVDTGMGFERVAGMIATTRGFTDFSRPPSNYNSDLFSEIFAAITTMCGQQYGFTMPDPTAPRERLSADEMRDVIFRVLADHIRTLTFAIADGILPGNEGRHYVLRRILRRAVMFGKRLNLPAGFFTRLIEPVVAKFGAVFPEVLAKQEIIRKVIANEEASFEKTLDRGLEMLNATTGDLSGERAFTLYDTYGFPLDLTQLIARERGLKVDVEGFHRCMEAQRQRGRDSQQTTKILVAEAAEGGIPATVFLGYDRETWRDCRARLLEIRPQGEATLLVFDQTPFYAEMGGQVGDSGRVVFPGGELAITDTVKDAAGHFLHRTILTEGVALPPVGAEVVLSIDVERRAAIQRHHSATHLLNYALRQVLGDHVVQRGSICGADRLRFDFSHYEAVTTDQIDAVEAIVNQRVLGNGSVSTVELPFSQKPAGVIATFGEKYGEVVRVVDIGGYSLELCGGTHVRAAGECGLFKVVSESSISAGVRRIEAVAGEAAYTLARETFQQLSRLATGLKCKPEEVEARLERLGENQRLLEKEVQRLKQAQASGQAATLLNQATQRGSLRLLAVEVDVADAADLKTLANDLCQKLGPSVVVLAAQAGGKVTVCAQCTPEAITQGFSAGVLVGQLTAALGGKGGGKANFAMGAGSRPEALEDALAALFR